MFDYRESVTGYKERIGRLALFDVFHQAANKQKKDAMGNDIDHYGMMLLTFLFFFECMLTRTKTSGINELAKYLKDATEKYYVLNDREYLEISKQMINLLRPAGGKRNRKEFINFESGKVDFVEISYLKVSDWNKEKNHQYYALDEQGLELIFASKEYYSEFQISISQLILRKQLEKGEFGGALRQIDEMRINVHSMRDKIIGIKHEIQSNSVSDEVYERYKVLINDINTRLNREHEEFEELTSFVQETKKHFEQDMNHSEKDRKAYQSIIQISNELHEVHNLHSKLLDDSIELKTKALEAARESMYYVGLTSFNFKQEVVGKMMSEPMPFMEGRLIAKPFMKMEQASIWSPVALFARQRIVNKDFEIKEQEFLDFSSIENKEELKKRKEIYKIVFSNFHQQLNDRGKSLSEILDHMPGEMLEMKEVYEMAVLLHQLSPIDVDMVKETKEHIFSEAMALIEEKEIELQVIELQGKTMKRNKVEISDMFFEFRKQDKSESERELR